jgi:hypothetical protein
LAAVDPKNKRVEDSAGRGAKIEKKRRTERAHLSVTLGQTTTVDINERAG